MLLEIKLGLHPIIYNKKCVANSNTVRHGCQRPKVALVQLQTKYSLSVLNKCPYLLLKKCH